MLLTLRKTFISLQPILLIASALLVIAGLKLSGNDLSSPWSTPNFYALGTWLIISIPSLIALRIIRPKHSPLLAPTLIFAMLLIGTGVTASFVCLIFLLSIYTTGTFIFNWLFSTSKHSNTCLEKLILGFSFYILVIGTMIHFPINYPATYLTILLAPIIALIAQQKSRIGFLIETKNAVSTLNQLLSRTAYWKLSSLLVLTGFVGIYAFLPSVTSDDNSYHLAMWSQLKTQHQFLFDVKTQIWYTAPFTLDMLHGFISVLAMMDARGSLNIMLLLFLTLAIINLASSIFKSQNQILLSAALFTSTPLLTNLILGLQTEIFLALLTTLGATIVCSKHISSPRKFLYLLLVSCILMSTKLPATLIAASLGLALLICEWRNLIEFRDLSISDSLKLLFVALLGCAIAFHPYINAYWITGNPTFPLYNATFQSPYFSPTNFKDETFTHGASLTAYLGFFFDSAKYFESYNFIAGFHYLILPIFGGLYLLINKSHKAVICLALPIFLYGGVMFYLMQYWRYFFPILPLACILAAASFKPSTSNSPQGYGRHISIGIFCFYVLLNIHYLPAASWILKNNPFENLTQEQKLATMKSYSSEAALNQYMNAHYPGESVLFEMDRSLGATLWAKPYYLAWISPYTLADFDKMQNSADLLAYLKEHKIRFIYRHDDPLANSFYFREFIKEVITQYGTKEMVSGNVSLYKLNY